MNSKRLLDWLYPRRCAFCDEVLGSMEKYLCHSCQRRMPKPIGEPNCKKCGKPLLREEQEYCYDCMHTHHYYERGLSLWNHKNPVNQSVYQFKYHNQRRYGILYSQELVKEFQKEIERWRPDIIMPVPLHPSRKRI